MDGHAETYVERHGELANKSVSQLERRKAPCMDEHHMVPEDFEVIGEPAPGCANRKW